jgi:hypothetical protein
MKLALSLMPDLLAIASAPLDEGLPSWVDWTDPLVSVTRTTEEFSVICRQDRVPPGVKSEGGWRVFKVAGPLSLSLTGILMRLLTPLAEAGVPILAFSTYDTDYVLVRDGRESEAASALSQVADVVP